MLGKERDKECSAKVLIGLKSLHGLELGENICENTVKTCDVMFLTRSKYH